MPQMNTNKHRLGLVFALIAIVATNVQAEPLKGLLHNEDCTNFFWYRSIPEGKAGESIDRYVDVLADAGVTVLFCNTNSRRTNYQSRAWDAYWDGYDPNGADDQPFLAAIPPAEVKKYREGIGNMLAVHKQGIDYPARVIERCRHDGISPWISLRMNDCHYNDNPNHPFHGGFWRKNPQLCRKNSPGYFANCLDYAHREVRDFYRSLIVETLDRYDVDGLELDFMRECYLFSAGEESQGAKILTEWLRGIRKLVDDAAAKHGHLIRLGVRVPSRPEVAAALGLDAVAWVNEGLIDLLVVTPRWASIEYDMPIQEWRKLLAGSKATLAGGLEVLYRPCPDGPAVACSPELAKGAAASVLTRGADAVYLFNYFQDGHPGWTPPVYRETLKSMTSLDSLLMQDRTVAVTFRDITAPGETYQPPLPATGKELVFSINSGPISDKCRVCELLIGVAQPAAGGTAVPAVALNGKPCKPVGDNATAEGLRLISFSAPAAALTDGGVQEVKVTGKDENTLTVRKVEMSFKECK